MTSYPRRRQPAVSDRPTPRPRRMELGLGRGRAYAVFGPRGVGVSTLLDILHESASTPTVLVSAADSKDTVTAAVADARAGRAEAIFIDGLPRREDDVQWLFDQRITTSFDGAIVRVLRHAVVPDGDYLASLPDIEARISALSIPYFTVHVDDPEQGVLDLLSRAGVTE